MAHSKVFESLGITLKNVQWSWSGRSADGSLVAVRIWQDRLEDKGRIYRSWPEDEPGEWRRRNGFRELMDNLAFARDHLAGEVAIVMIVAKDPSAKKRSIARSFTRENLKMRVTELDMEQGTFTLERIAA